MLRFIFAKSYTSFHLRSTENVHNLVFLDIPFVNGDKVDDDQHCIQKCFPFGTVIKLMIDAPDHLPNSCNRNIYKKKHKCNEHTNFKTTMIFSKYIHQFCQFVLIVGFGTNQKYTPCMS